MTNASASPSAAENKFGLHGYENTKGVSITGTISGIKTVGIIKEPDDRAKYIVLFDPLDGSSNIDSTVSIGTIFSILQRRPDVEKGKMMDHILQPGIQQIAAGYVVYGSSTVMCYTTGDGVHMFTLDPNIGAFRLIRERVCMPTRGKTYSINEAYSPQSPKASRNI